MNSRATDNGISSSRCGRVHNVSGACRDPDFDRAKTAFQPITVLDTGLSVRSWLLSANRGLTSAQSDGLDNLVATGSEALQAGLLSNLTLHARRSLGDASDEVEISLAWVFDLDLRPEREIARKQPPGRAGPGA